MAEKWINTKFGTLRRRAENEMKGLPRGIYGLSQEDNQQLIEDMLARREHVARLVEELQIHQVELDLQNDELQQTHRRLSLSYERYANLYNHAPVSYVTTTQRGVIIEANQTAARLLGVSQQELLHTALTAFVVPEDQDIYYFHRYHLAETRIAQTCALRLRHLNGTIIHVRLESSCDVDEQNFLSFQTIILNITDQVYAEAALHEAQIGLEERLQERTANLTHILAVQRLLAHISDALMEEADVTTRLRRTARLIVEQMALVCLVVLRSDTGQPDLRVVIPTESAYEPAVRAWLEHDLAVTGEKHPLLMVLQGSQTMYLGERAYTDTSIGMLLSLAGNQNGATVRLSTIVVPLLIHGKIIGVLSLIHNVSSRMYTPDDLSLAQELARRIATALHNASLYAEAQQSRADAELTLQQHEQMVHLISHDLKTPLAVIQGYCYMLQRHVTSIATSGPEVLDRDIGKIKAAADMMDRHIQDLLDTATIQAGQSLVLKYVSIDIFGLVRGCGEACQSLSPQHSIQVETSGLELSCTGDEIRLTRALNNLITNAIKYSPYNSSIRILVHAETQKNTPGVAIQVIDEGMGIPTDDIVHLFEPFYRGRNVVRVTSGNGLGLTVVKQIIEQHGGTIAITSQEGGGATFTIWLPVNA